MLKECYSTICSECESLLVQNLSDYVNCPEARSRINRLVLPPLLFSVGVLFIGTAIYLIDKL
ncbi:hypothetical protein [Geobacter sulfurreducens]|uniref:hypothetical protein n=1 Tax=Geobacter sulfurreducens TaxID=35554 RepID=UPI000DBB5E8D|nr:hypothetical protein [Geobacter sulfurreducens]BBA70627.1 hypothetical protein YM18_2108 [Geobacter sulfurreducens]